MLILTLSSGFSSAQEAHSLNVARYLLIDVRLCARLRKHIRHKEQDRGRCMCPYRFIWKCDGECLDCEYHAAGDITSLDQPLSDGNGTLGDYIPDRSKPMEKVIADRMLLEQLFARLRELDPDADTIIQCWLDDYKISDRAIAEKLGRKQRTFADQMKKIRTELRRLNISSPVQMN